MQPPNWGLKIVPHVEGLHDQRGPGPDLRGEPIEVRKATLACLLRGSLPGLRLNRAAKGTHVRKCKCGKASLSRPRVANVNAQAEVNCSADRLI